MDIDFWTDALDEGKSYYLKELEKNKNLIKYINHILDSFKLFFNFFLFFFQSIHPLFVFTFFHKKVWKSNVNINFILNKEGW